MCMCVCNGINMHVHVWAGVCSHMFLNRQSGLQAIIGMKIRANRDGERFIFKCSEGCQTCHHWVFLCVTENERKKVHVLAVCRLGE